MIPGHLAKAVYHLIDTVASAVAGRWCMAGCLVCNQFVFVTNPSIEFIDDLIRQAKECHQTGVSGNALVDQ